VASSAGLGDLPLHNASNGAMLGLRRFAILGNADIAVERKPMSRWQREHHLIALGICGVFCLVAGSALSAGDTLDGDYTGTRTLRKVVGSLCPAREDVSASVQGHTLTFTYSALKNYTIGLDPDSDGSFNQISMEEGGHAVKIQGRIIGEIIEADVANPSCEYHWVLKKK